MSSVAIIILIAFVLSPVFPYARSLAVMSAYSPLCARDSIMKKEGFSLKIPTGDTWYPFVMTYTADDEFSAYSGLPDSKLTILYNFPAFAVKEGCSRLYDESSPYYSSFYGAYIVQCEDGEPYGFSSVTAEPEPEALSNIAKFDFFTLVLRDFGLPSDKRVFSYSLTDETGDLSFAGYDGWTRLETDIRMNGANHKPKGFTASYLQYGKPNFKLSSDFAPVYMKGIIYARYFEEWKSTVFFYVMSPSADVCADCENNILANSTIDNVG